VVGFPPLPPPPLDDLSFAFSTWINDSFACALTGLPSGRKSMYWTLRLSATALNMTVLPQLNVIIGGRPLFLPLPEPSALLISIALKSVSVTLRTSSELSDASNRRSSVSLRGCPPLNCAVGSAVPTTGSIFHWFCFWIVYSLGLNQHWICAPPSISSVARLKPDGGGNIRGISDLKEK